MRAGRTAQPVGAALARVRGADCEEWHLAWCSVSANPGGGAGKIGLHRCIHALDYGVLRRSKVEAQLAIVLEATPRKVLRADVHPLVGVPRVDVDHLGVDVEVRARRRRS